MKKQKIGIIFIIPSIKFMQLWKGTVEEVALIEHRIPQSCYSNFNARNKSPNNLVPYVIVYTDSLVQKYV